MSTTSTAPAAGAMLASSATTNPDHVPTPTWRAYAIGVILVGTSAGMLLYTRKTSSMLRTLEHYQKPLQKPVKVGPPTKEEWEKIRPRFDDEDIV